MCNSTTFRLTLNLFGESRELEFKSYDLQPDIAHSTGCEFVARCGRTGKRHWKTGIRIHKRDGEWRPDFVYYKLNRNSGRILGWWKDSYGRGHEMVKATQRDRSAMVEVRRIYERLRSEDKQFIRERNLGERVSEWLGQSHFVKSVSEARLNRLIDLGWIQRQSSDGHGPEIKVVQA